MIDQDKKRFAEIMLALAENFSCKLSSPGIALRFDALKEFPIERVEDAAKQLLQYRKFTKMPTVADFVDTMHGNPADLAEVQAAKVYNAIEQIGGNKTVVFDDATTMAVIRYGFGGWVKLCDEQLAKNQNWFMKDFVRIYQAYKRQRIVETGKLIGRTEADNTAAGYMEYIPDPVLIGDRSRCAEIMAGIGGKNTRRIQEQAHLRALTHNIGG